MAKTKELKAGEASQLIETLKSRFDSYHAAPGFRGALKV